MSEYVSAKAARRAEEEKARKERKKYNAIVGAVAGVIVLMILFVALFGSNLFYNGTAALEIGGTKFTVADFNYNYFSSYNSYYNSVYSYSGTIGDPSAMLPSTEEPLRTQAYLGSEDMTWADFFENSAIERMKSVAMLTSAAEEEGYTLSDEEKASVEETITGLAASAVSNGYKDLDAYLTINYGKGMTEKVFRENLLRDALASSYSQHKLDSSTFTQEELTAYYAEHADENDYFKFRIYSFSGAAVTDDADTEEDETLSAEDAAAKAQADADAFLAAVTDEQSFIDYAASLNEDTEDYDADSTTLRTSQGSSITEVVRTWLVEDGRKAGDKAVVRSAEDAAIPYYYVVYYLDRDNNAYNAFSGYYGLVSAAPTVEGGGDPDAASLKTYREGNAKMVLDSYIEADGKGLDTFSEVINNATDLISGSGALTTTGIYDVPQVLADWFSDPARQEGDTEILYDEDYGAFVVYFSQIDGVYADLLSEAKLKSDAYDAWEEAQMANYETVTRHWQMGLSKKLASMGG